MPAPVRVDEHHSFAVLGGIASQSNHVAHGEPGGGRRLVEPLGGRGGGAATGADRVDDGPDPAGGNDRDGVEGPEVHVPLRDRPAPWLAAPPRIRDYGDAGLLEALVGARHV